MRYALAVLLLVGCRAAQPLPGTDGDGASPEALSRAVHEVVSGPAGEPRDWARYRALFRDGATFTTWGEKLGWFTFGVDEYIEWYGPAFLANGIEETELSGSTDSEGRVAQRWSRYEYRWPSGELPDGTCRRTMQFVHEDGRWWITSLVWETEDRAEGGS